jgi:hypothetical protein
MDTQKPEISRNSKIRKRVYRRVIQWFAKNGEPWMLMECGHSKPVPRGIYGGENERRVCFECANARH